MLSLSKQTATSHTSNQSPPQQVGFFLAITQQQVFYITLRILRTYLYLSSKKLKDIDE